MIRFDEKRVVRTNAGGGVGTWLLIAPRNAGAQVVACDIEGFDLLDDLETHRFSLGDSAAIVKSRAGGHQKRPARCLHLERGEDPRPNPGRSRPRDPGARAGIELHWRVGLVGPPSACDARTRCGDSPFRLRRSCWPGCAPSQTKRPARAVGHAICSRTIEIPGWDARLAAAPGAFDKVVRPYPSGRFVTPAEVAQATLFLASPLAPGITGATSQVDAGLTTRSLLFIDAIT